MAGLGQHPLATQAVSAGGSIASGVSLPLLVPLLGLGPAGLIAAGIMGVTIAIEALINSGCGQTCVVTSQWANQAEGLLKQNIAEYFAITPPRPQSVQQQALQNFQTIWNTLVQQCSQPGLGTAGQNCINDRKDGGCKWQAAPPSYPGEPAAGSCWNWWNGYYYPIKNDLNVVPDAALAVSSAGGVVSSAASTVSSAVSSLTSNPILLLGVGLIGIAILTQL